MHDDEIAIPVDTVRRLISEQFPQWAGLAVRRVDSSGTVNAIFRIGDELAARFPLRQADPSHVRESIEREARATADFALHSPFPAPVPVAIGEPGAGYPLSWSVQTWLSGDAADEDLGDSDEFAGDIASLIGALRAVDTGGRRFEHGWRGGDLHDHDDWVQECLDKSRELLDVARLAALWGHFRELPRESPDVMSHGDLTPANLLVGGGRLTGVLDCGGFGPADPALDLIASWHLLDDGPRALVRRRLGADDLEWERSKAWAFEQSMGAVWYYAETNPTMSRMGRRTLDRVSADTPL